MFHQNFSMGPFQRTPKRVARDIRPLRFVRSVGPVGDFLESEFPSRNIPIIVGWTAGARPPTDMKSVSFHAIESVSEKNVGEIDG